ncbi:MAG TPA: hypothetical protein VF460_01980 [Burkholderiales bacterium]
MNATKLIIAAGFAIATTGAFAETGVRSASIDNVSNVYGRAGVAAVKIQGATAVSTQPGNVADSGREVVKGETQIAVTAGSKDVNAADRS